MQVSIISLSRTKAYKDMRFDAEFYFQELLYVTKKIEEYDFCYMRDVATIRSGTTPRERSDDLKQGIVLLKTTNIRDNMLCYTHPDDFFFIDEETNKKMRSTQLKTKDVLLNIVGATTDVIGRTSMIFGDFPKSNITQAMAFCRIEKSGIFPEYIFTFLRSYFGKTQTKYIARPTGQYNLNLQEVGYIRVPLLSETLQTVIKKLVCLAKDFQEKSQSLYSEVSNILLDEINLMDWKPKHRLSFVKNFSNTQSVSRLNAEYFQPKYDEIVKAIKGYKNGWDELVNLFKQNKKKFKKDDNKKYSYLEIGGVNVSSGEIEPQEILGEELPANAKIKLHKDDLVVSKVRTYRGAVAIIERNDLIGSGAFTVLNETGGVNKETLFVLLKSLPYLEFSLKFNTGTSYPVIVDDDILNYPIPLIEDSIQAQIQWKITESFTLRKQSKHLLECAKKAVEMAIERDEKTAMEWVKEQGYFEE